jgi:glyoxylase-like metal-dependent hydrolase (beta-lactamase superfamily II)
MPLLLPAGNASAWTGPTGNNTWLLAGGVPTLVDAGVGSPQHLDAVERALATTTLAQVLITHGHADHVSGLPALQERWPGLHTRQYGAGRGLRHDEYIRAGDAELRVLHTPGHSPDHCCFFDERSGDLYCGDLARLGGTVVIPATRGGNLTDYLASLRLVKSLLPGRLLPGHGPIVEDPQALLSAYLAHRAQRDEQIVRAVAVHPRTARDIVREVYPSIDAAFERAAAETVLAHLIKLRDEGRVRLVSGDAEGNGTWIQAS